MMLTIYMLNIRIAHLRFKWQSMKAAPMALQLTKFKPSQGAPQLEAVDLLQMMYLQPNISFMVHRWLSLGA